jgi:hypothetical protein
MREEHYLLRWVACVGLKSVGLSLTSCRLIVNIRVRPRMFLEFGVAFGIILSSGKEQLKEVEILKRVKGTLRLESQVII